MAASPTISFFSSSIFLPTSNTKLHFLKTEPRLRLRSTTARARLATLLFPSSKKPRSVQPSSTPPNTACAIVHRGIPTDLTNSRRGTASTLTRVEVRGGGIKSYAQKKTGRARRWSIRTPLRPVGGVIFGPKPKDWSVKINKKEKRLAISTAISSAFESTVVVEDFDDKFDKPQTKAFVEMLKRLGLDPKKKSFFLVTQL